LLAPPLLASLVWRIYQQTEDRAFLEETLTPLRRFLMSWLIRSHDRDGDGIPEWDHALQAGLDYHPGYSGWQTVSLDIDITTAESPSLSAMLYEECQSLLQIAEQTGREAETAGIADLAQKIKERVEAAWEAEEASYFDVDRDTHQSSLGELILEVKGSGSFLIQRNYPKPARLCIQVRTDETIRRRPLLFLHGKNMSGNQRVERLNDDQFRWIPGLGQLTGKYVYSYLERLEARNLEPEDQITIRSVNYHTAEVTSLAPLWAGIPDVERAGKLVEQTITNPSLFWHSFGLPTCPRPAEQVDQLACWNVNLPWNRLVIEGLIRYGYREQAAQLLTRQISAIVKSLAQERTFRRAYHADTGAGLGEFTALSGIAPVGLFLETLGVRLISAQRVALAGMNPFPWPVTVKYRGLTILRQKDKTIVIFPDNQTVTVTDPEPCLVALQAHE
jgi:glycogen debranching enzyme